MDVLELIIKPFLFLIEELFSFSYRLSGNYGLSIILLSFFVSSLLLPVFILIEKQKKKDNRLKLKMQPFVDEIKRCYKGQERFYYLKTLNRQFGYSQTKALIPILSLLLQIPFFIAAYQFLKDFDPIAGVGFLVIKDLGLPDGLLGPINLLPIFMTLVNLFTAYFYTRNDNVTERRQMLLVAGIFLVLLFNLPAGLVLYWTMNNVFSFFRLFVTNPEVFRKALKRGEYRLSLPFAKVRSHFFLQYGILKFLFVVISIIGILSQVNWAYQNSFDGLITRIIGSITGSFILTVLVGIGRIVLKELKTNIITWRVKPIIFYTLLFSSTYFYLAAKSYYQGVNTSLLNLSLFFLIPTQFIGLLYVAKNNVNLKSWVRFIVFLLLVLVFLNQLFHLIVILSKNNIYLKFCNVNLVVGKSKLIDFISSGLVFSFVTTPVYYSQDRFKLAIAGREGALVYYLAVIYLCGFIFLWNPILVFASFPDTFDFLGIDILKSKIGHFIATITLLVLLYKSLPKHYKSYSLLFTLVITVTSFINNTILPIDVGTLQLGKYIQEQNLAIKPVFYFFEAILFIFTFLLAVFIINKQRYKYLIIFLLLINVVLVPHSIISGLRTEKFFHNKNKQLSSASLTFSKEKNNVVYFVADMFMGMYIPKILEDNPELKQELDGFVWYPNSVSVSAITISSFSSMFLGYDFTVDKLNKDTERSMGEKLTEASERFVQKVKSKNYHFTGSSIVYSDIDENSFDTHMPMWHEDWNKWNNKLKLGLPFDLDYAILSENAMFYSAPLFLKSRIYNYGKWLHGTLEENKGTNASKSLNFVRLLPNISDTLSSKGNFIFYHCKATHLPWSLIDSDGNFVEKVTPYENQKWFLIQFVKWIKWMKENDVYNNTKIVLVSDHAHHLPVETANEFGGKFKWDDAGREKLSAQYFWRLNSLMLIKDYNASGKMKEDWRLMSNGDCPAIVFNENDPTKSRNNKNRVIPVSFTDWNRNLKEQNSMQIFHQFEVRENIYNSKNWTPIN